MIEPLHLLDIPADAEHGWKYEAVHRLIVASRLDSQGNTDLVPSVRSLAADRANRLYCEQQWILAVQGSQEVGWAQVGLPIHEDREKASISVSVHPRMRRQGIGSALLDWGETLIAHANRTVMFSSVVYTPAEDHEPYLTTEEGSRVPVGAASVAFSRKKGYALAHAERRSVLNVPMDPSLTQHLMEQTLPHTEGYRLHTWYDTIPQEWKEPFARLKEAFSSDAPQGALQFEQEHWNTERVDQMVRDIHGQENFFVMTAAEHVATGELAGFTELRWPQTPGEQAAEQWFTIVSRAHRGHRLGMWMKLANLGELTSRCPEIRRVHTDNAQENSHMLAINIAMGFTPNGGNALMTKSVQRTPIPVRDA